MNCTTRFQPTSNREKLGPSYAKRRFDISACIILMCSLHFTEEDYERDLMHELLNFPIRKKLKKGVVPTLNLMKKLKQT
ncbi:Uncharacterized protein FKW44_022417, partial [Caligus rogercresseyi]